MNSALNTPTQHLENLFSDISLQQLEQKAALLSRANEKYIVTKSMLQKVLNHLSSHFNILNIKGQTSFQYASYYFDDEHCSSFLQHQQGKRTRFKVRTRHYIDSDTCFVEIKVKGSRGHTHKKRMPYAVEKAKYLDEEAIAFIKAVYYETYNRPFSYTLRLTLCVRYQRTTLVAINGHERMTIDMHIQFSGAGKSHNLNTDTTIIETKTSNSRGLARQALKRLHQHPISGCSKYCLGQILLGNVSRYNHFLKAVRALRKIDQQLLISNTSLNNLN